MFIVSDQTLWILFIYVNSSRCFVGKSRSGSSGLRGEKYWSTMSCVTCSKLGGSHCRVHQIQLTITILYKHSRTKGSCSCVQREIVFKDHQVYQNKVFLLVECDGKSTLLSYKSNIVKKGLNVAPSQWCEHTFYWVKSREMKLLIK